MLGLVIKSGGWEAESSLGLLFIVFGWETQTSGKDIDVGSNVTVFFTRWTRFSAIFLRFLFFLNRNETSSLVSRSAQLTLLRRESIPFASLTKPTKIRDNDQLKDPTHLQTFIYSTLFASLSRFHGHWTMTMATTFQLVLRSIVLLENTVDLSETNRRSESIASEKGFTWFTGDSIEVVPWEKNEE